MSSDILEIVTWKSKNNIKDSDMIKAINNMVDDLKELDGFCSQTLYKNDENVWVDIYYWETVESAKMSSQNMCEKDSFKKLMMLIDADTVTVEISEPLQSSLSLD